MYVQRPSASTSQIPSPADSTIRYSRASRATDSIELLDIEMVDFRPAGCNVVVGRVTYIRPPRALEEPNLGVLCRPNTDNRICRARIVLSGGRLHIITTRFLSRAFLWWTIYSVGCI